jgi:hypothetical protein
MRLCYAVLLFLITISATKLVLAQEQDLVPVGVEALGQNASSRTDFTLNHSMLVLASKLEKSDNEDLRRVIAGVNGVSVHSYQFSKSATYDSDALKLVLQQFRAAGWTRLVDKQPKNGMPGETDLWIRFENTAISKIAVLLAKQNQLNFIAVSGSISPLDLVHLSGHFGIPLIEGGVRIPEPSHK